MKSQYFYKSILAVAILGLAACKPSLDTTVPSKGTADFSRYIAIGNSLTSGYADNGLYLEGQKNSFPEMIGEQMKAVGGGSFTSPFFTDAQSNGAGYISLTGFTATGSPIITPVTTNLAVRGEVTIPGVAKPVTLYTKFTGDINNYGVPGIKLLHVNYAPYGNLNGYFERLLPGNAGTNNTSYLEFVTAKPYTFFSMWLGNNDILGYAVAGGADPDETPTPKSTFSALYNGTVAKLISTGAKGVVATIPDVTKTAYFTTVTLQALLDAVHANPAAASIKDIYIKTGSGAVRAATTSDLFVLTLSSANVIGVPNGSGIPYGLHPLNALDSKWVLDKDEVATVNDYVDSYNATIKSAASANGLALMDANAMLKEFSKVDDNGKSIPVAVNGAAVSSAFVTGNLFSLDGIHLTPMGYAITANGFIKAINAKYGSSIPTVDVTKYRGVKFP